MKKPTRKELEERIRELEDHRCPDPRERYDQDGVSE